MGKQERASFSMSKIKLSRYAAEKMLNGQAADLPIWDMNGAHCLKLDSITIRGSEIIFSAKNLEGRGESLDICGIDLGHVPDLAGGESLHLHGLLILLGFELK